LELWAVVRRSDRAHLRGLNSPESRNAPPIIPAGRFLLPCCLNPFSSLVRHSADTKAEERGPTPGAELPPFRRSAG
jgi:hypothetical protein